MNKAKMKVQFPYLYINQLNSSDIADGAEKMDPFFLYLINSIGLRLGKKLKINSGYRTIKHNSIVGGSKTSSHLKGLAVDISAKTSRDRFYILSYALYLGINRIGIYRNFIHLDIDTSKAPKVIWYN